jgi:hypothetical protein
MLLPKDLIVNDQRIKNLQKFGHYTQTSPNGSRVTIELTSLSYPARSIEGELNMHHCRFHNYRFFQPLIPSHTFHKKIHRPASFRDKSP